MRFVAWGYQVGMAAVLAAAWAAPALGADPEPPESLDDRELAWMAVFIVVGVALMVLSWVTRLHVRSVASTDPRKLAADDPWVRAYLARTRAAGSASPHDRVSPGQQLTEGPRPRRRCGLQGPA